MTAGCWLGDVGRESILQDGTTHVESIANHFFGMLSLYGRLIPHTDLRVASYERGMFYQLSRREQCTKRQLCKMGLPDGRSYFWHYKGVQKANRYPTYT